MVVKNHSSTFGKMSVQKKIELSGVKGGLILDDSI